MLIAAVIILGVALSLGAVLAILHMRGTDSGLPPRWLGALHGALALAGLTGLVLALRGPARGMATGTAAFGTIAAVMIGLAALIGGAILATHLVRRRTAGVLIGIHASLAVGGFVILAVYLIAG